MKRRLLLSMLLLGLFGCQQQGTLDPPTNVRYEEETILWDPVEGATSYNVVLNDTTYAVIQPQLDMTNQINGDYRVRVRANNTLVSSVYSTTLLFTVDRMYDPPTNLAIEDGVMTWQGSDDAEGYVVMVNEVEYPTSSTMFDLSVLKDNEAHVLTVKAVFALGSSDYSAAIEYWTYVDVIARYPGIYNKNILHDPYIYLDAMYEIEHVAYLDEMLANEDFFMEDDILFINYHILEGLALGVHIIELYTPEGIVELTLDVTEHTNPMMVTPNSIRYVEGEDVECLFELFDAAFVRLSGHDIVATDYEFANDVLTIHATYLDVKLSTFEGDTIIFTYQLQVEDGIILGYLFIWIPID